MKKGLSFFVLLGCGIFITCQEMYGSRLSTIVRSGSICFYFIHTHGKGSGTIWDSRLHSHHWAFSSTRISICLKDNSVQTTKLKLISHVRPSSSVEFHELGSTPGQTVFLILNLYIFFLFRFCFLILFFYLWVVYLYSFCLLFTALRDFRHNVFLV